MVYFEIYSKCLRVRYTTTICSKTTLFMLVTFVAKIVLPFVIAYHTQGFWMKSDRFLEQPVVKYRYEYLFAADTNVLENPVLCTNMFRVSDNFDRCSQIQILETDHDRDGLNDELHARIIVETSNKFKLTTATLLLGVHYEIRSVCPTEIHTFIALQDTFTFPMTEIMITGDVLLHQVSPMVCKNREVVSLPMFNEEFNLQNILQEHSEQNVTVRVDNIYKSWTSGSGSQLTINTKFRYPENVIHYRPGFWQMIKNAWIQYFAVYIVISWFIMKVREYVFVNKLVLYRTN